MGEFVPFYKTIWWDLIATAMNIDIDIDVDVDIRIDQFAEN